MFLRLHGATSKKPMLIDVSGMIIENNECGGTDQGSIIYRLGEEKGRISVAESLDEIERLLPASFRPHYRAKAE